MDASTGITSSAGQLAIELMPLPAAKEERRGAMDGKVGTRNNARIAIDLCETPKEEV